ncbi:CLUMA_CG012558, isoform A [Clunio marinus]|uniref:Phenylalanine--tRNA ligase, mitochondrial n=1 Tax=Clunio marinus TaxID=568069 RepID=A0A1J1IIV8_9DIPT|nr:CLUMA_CG012558, isoform A [Clunio marinus]
MLCAKQKSIFINFKSVKCLSNVFSRLLSTQTVQNVINLNNNKYESDDYSNLTPKIMSYLGRNIYLQKNHPLSMMRQKIIKYFYQEYSNPKGTPLFSVYDRLSPVVSTKQNFDYLLIPPNHPSRAKSDCYYINREYMLRGHCTAHQLDLLRSGLDNFLIVGDVYRRDEIDSTHFPVFHQVDAVRVVHNDKLFKNNPDLEIFEKEFVNNDIAAIGSSDKCIDQVKQPCHTVEAVKLIEHEMKNVLEGMVKAIFGKTLKHRWVDAFFPFTQPSWELEIFHKGKWVEILGAGVMRNQILKRAGVDNSIGYAFGLGLERLAMILYEIPDIRLFWSKDSGFLNQFDESDLKKIFKYKPVSQYPQCANDISFWLPTELPIEAFSPNDFYDLVRNIAGDIAEQVTLYDKFTHPKTGRNSLCFRIVYRHMERTLTQKEVNEIHSNIGKSIVDKYGVTIR